MADSGAGSRLPVEAFRQGPVQGWTAQIDMLSAPAASLHAHGPDTEPKRQGDQTLHIVIDQMGPQTILQEMTRRSRPATALTIVGRPPNVQRLSASLGVGQGLANLPMVKEPHGRAQLVHVNSRRRQRR
jgi:hypothetical protein